MKITLLVIVVMVLAAIAVPNLQKGRCHHSPERRCLSNQKTLAGALEMYYLDKCGASTIVITRELLDTLVKEGYLQSLPRDPGDASPDSWKNYIYIPAGNGIACVRHGVVQPGGLTPRQQLLSLGVTDPEILARLVDDPLPPWDAGSLTRRALRFCFQMGYGWVHVLGGFLFLLVNSQRMLRHRPPTP